MITKHAILAVTLLVLLVGGCGPQTGLLIRPVAVRDELQETVVARDGGRVHHKVVVLDLDGILLNRRSEGFLGPGENPVSLFLEKLDRAEADPAVRAVVLRVNSPGGSVTASDIMHSRLMEFRRRSGKPVVAILEDVGASGAYYIACGADTILAHPTTVTGSIGVVMQTLSLSGTLAKLGIEARAIVSGPHKDMGSVLRPLDPANTEIIQSLVNEFYERFVAVVRQGRPELSETQARTLADGRVYSGTQARDLGLVDDVGYLHDAIALAKQRAGLERVRVVMYHRPFGYRATVYSESPLPSPQVNLLNIQGLETLLSGQPRFLYLWTTGH